MWKISPSVVVFLVEIYLTPATSLTSLTPSKVTLKKFQFAS